ncbi:MAG: hypothetical protein B7Y99_13200 [Caulobacterales bacterium 32-69-10]|nr:MAG: hypothetical protein B7Y99_13200 [Caulobacterales bacterium 32-69-10]
MRPLAALALTGLIASAAPAAFAADVPAISVGIGADLQSKAEKSYGVRELDYLKKDLTREVAEAFSRSNAQPVQSVDLVIESATPNRPTFRQLQRPGLSMESLGLGGASITGTITGLDGVVTPVSYHWYETNFQNLWAAVSWSDAWRTFDRFAGRIARGDRPQQARFTPDRYAGDFGRWR